MPSRFALGLLALALTGCAGVGRRDVSPGPLPAGVVVFGSSVGVTSIDAASGSIVFSRGGVPALGDWSKLFTTSTSTRGTALESYDAASGRLVARMRIPEGFGVRVAAHDGTRVALVRGAPEPNDWTPHPRATTEIMVVDPSGETRPERYVLRGNFDPEAFSQDGRRLLLLEYVPPTAPEAYRVASLNLARGKVVPVFLSHAKRVAETMSGTRLEQLASPDGRRLFTLYTSQPPAYSSGASALAEPVAFVHVLDLRAATAHCVALPRELWGGDPRFEAMALSPDGAFLYVVDVERAIVTEISTRDGEVTRTAAVDLGTVGGKAHAIMTGASTLVVGAGTEIVTLDTKTLRGTDRRAVDDSVDGLGLAEGALYVATSDGSVVLEPETGEALGELPSPDIDDLAYVGSAQP